MTWLRGRVLEAVAYFPDEHIVPAVILFIDLFINLIKE